MATDTATPKPDTTAAVTGWRSRRRDAIWIGGLAVVLAVFPLVASSRLVNVGVYALIYGIAALGLALLMGAGGPG
jgi:branched-chain amino acid transport system permease protein